MLSDCLFLAPCWLQAQELGWYAMQTVVSKHLKHNVDEHAAQVNSADKNYQRQSFSKVAGGWLLIQVPDGVVIRLLKC